MTLESIKARIVNGGYFSRWAKYPIEFTNQYSRLEVVDLFENVIIVTIEIN